MSTNISLIVGFALGALLSSGFSVNNLVLIVCFAGGCVLGRAIFGSREAE